MSAPRYFAGWDVIVTPQGFTNGDRLVTLAHRASDRSDVLYITPAGELRSIGCDYLKVDRLPFPFRTPRRPGVPATILPVALSAIRCAAGVGDTADTLRLTVYDLLGLDALSEAHDEEVNDPGEMPHDEADCAVCHARRVLGGAV